MASPTPRRPAEPPRSAPEVVDPRWLLKGLGLTIGAAILLGYLAVCWIVYQAGWQSMLAPTPTIGATPATPYQALRFDAGPTGAPRLSAWWIPADSQTATTILFLHGGNGSLSSSVRTLDLLHEARVNVFAFDYRGFGQSDGPHPSEARMAEDADAALDYMVNTRHLPPGAIIPYGEGLGAVLAANLLNGHSDLPALIIDYPDPAAYARATQNTRSSLLPMRLLIRDRFDLASALRLSQKPKLLLVDTPFGFTPDRVAANQALFRTVPDPKVTVTFHSISAQSAYVKAIRRFLDLYVPAT